MNYFPSDFLNHLARHDSRLIPIRSGATGPLLIEEKHLGQEAFFRGEHFTYELVVLTESENAVPYLGECKVLRAVYKYLPTRHLLARIFNEPHEVRLFISLNRAFGLQLQDSKFFDAGSVAVLDDEVYSDVLLQKNRDSLSGVHYLYSSILDVVDPPVSQIIRFIEERSLYDEVDVLAYTLSGSIIKKLIDLSDVVYLFSSFEYAKNLSPLLKKYSHIQVIVTSFNQDALSLLERYDFSRKDQYEFQRNL